MNKAVSVLHTYLVHIFTCVSEITKSCSLANYIHTKKLYLLYHFTFLIFFTDCKWIKCSYIKNGEPGVHESKVMQFTPHDSLVTEWARQT